MGTILVTVSEIATLQDNFEIEGTEVPEKYKSFDLNEWDDYALEEAVQISEEEDDVEVVTVTIGPERSEETIRTALAKGADRAIRVWDDEFADAGLLTPESKASILEAVVAQEDPEFVLTGVQSGDDAFAATGVTLASKLGDEWAAVVTDLERDGDVSHVHRELEGGVDEVSDVEMPAVFTIQTGINEPRYASLRGIRQAQQKELAVSSLDDLGLGPDALETPLSLTSMTEPESEGDATIWEGDADETAAELADFLRNSGVVEG
ncbi:electron transfer flavoprotein subunit beta/FixA family protein [Haloarculaceae archaeon H-GB2-1]|nr:electron transfer flavoprotein subunit beta/FixA family protein [Haloarculaceae archaeon H-GB11]MEA5407913.1 electron transfer flavoprotein subunit beta/FixA family protein [Haloarculaceae archaeon H-GB2-1]